MCPPIIGAQAAVPSLTVGGQVFTDLTNLIQLVGSGGGSAITDKTTLRLPGASSGYQVPVGRTLRIMAARARVFATAAAGSAQFNILYGDADVGVAGNTAFTNAVYRGGGGLGLSQFGNKSVVSNFVEETFYFDVPAGKYPSVQALDTANPSNIVVFGYLV